MNNILPTALLELIDQLGLLPGVGARTAERYAYAILRRDAKQAKNLASALENLHTNIKIYVPLLLR